MLNEKWKIGRKGYGFGWEVIDALSSGWKNSASLLWADWIGWVVVGRMMLGLHFLQVMMGGSVVWEKHGVVVRCGIEYEDYCFNGICYRHESVGKFGGCDFH